MHAMKEGNRMDQVLPTQFVSRLNAARRGPGGAVYRVVSDATVLRGSCCVFEVCENPGGGPPLHMHTREDECFHVLEGEVTFWVDGKVHVVSAGGSLFAPRNVPHTFKNCSSAPFRMIFVATPGDIESFFDFGAPNADGSEPSDEVVIERIVRTAPEYGMRILGPSPL